MTCLVFRLRRIFAVFSRYSSGIPNMASGDSGNSEVFPPKPFPLACVVAYSYKCPLLATKGIVRSLGSLRRIPASSATYIRGGNLHFINRTCRPPVGGLYVYYISMTGLDSERI